MSDATLHEAALRLAGRTTGRHPAPPAPKPSKAPKAPEPPQVNVTVLALLDALHLVELKLQHHGDLLMQRTVDWHKVPTDPAPRAATADDDDEDQAKEGTSDRDVEDRQGDVLASRYKDELRTLTARLRSDLARLVQIDAVVIRAQPKRLEGKDMLAVQVAAEGFCVSCWRYDQTIKEREKDKHGHFFNKEACRRCAAFKADYGQYPPLVLLEAWHARGKNWTTATIAQALGRG